MKGGRIGRDQVTGEWRSVDRTEHVHPIRDPFAQVKASKHALLAALDRLPHRFDAIVVDEGQDFLES